MSSKDRKDDTETLVSTGRRSLLRRAALTAPVIATLPSGAALARSSNLISSTTAVGAQDAWGRTQCLENASVYSTDGTTADLGEPPYGRVNAIVDRDHRTDARGSADPVQESDMCVNGGTYYYRAPGGWQPVNVPRGMLVSGTALSSFTGAIVTREI